MKKKATFAVFVLSGLIIGYAFWTSDERRIERLIVDGIKACEARDVDRVMSKISLHYRDDYGMTYLLIKERLKREFRIFSTIQIEYGDLTVTVSEGDAGVVLQVRVLATAGDETGYVLGDVKAPARIRLSLAKERMQWYIIKAEGFESAQVPAH